MPATRIIIDMQASFPAANQPNVVAAVAAEILKAKKEKAAIMVVEYSGNGDTHSGLMDLLKGYPLLAVIHKGNDGGGAEVVRALRRRKFSQTHLRICGVNIDCCVSATVREIVSLIPNVHIHMVRKACGWNRNKEFKWDTFRKDYLYGNKRMRLV